MQTIEARFKSLSEKRWLNIEIVMFRKRVDHMKLTTKYIGEKNGQIIYEYSIQNNQGLKFSCTNFGCIITKLIVPDREGRLENIVLGFDTIEEYENNPHFIGAVIGQHAGRVAKGKILIDGKVIQLPCNEGGNQLHGGRNGFDKSIWNTTIMESKDEIVLQFEYTSVNGDNGFPGAVAAKVKYIFNNADELIVEYRGICDQKTVLNMTNHSYFNLSGNLRRDISQHILKINSSHFLSLNDELLPTGSLEDVEGTVFDFRSERVIADGIHSANEQVIIAGQGYDHPFKLLKSSEYDVVLKDDNSGRQLSIITNNPYIVLYTGQKLGDGNLFGDIESKNYLGLCLETQLPPYSIEYDDLRESTLEKGKEYYKYTKYIFTTN
ncbi:aldose epimerase family protein [Viridibacillus sp. FSL E2-0187]|uniref:aldose epimerase family protein n=1 Tax=Viridibacillus TaxID=496496 RepID=UPI0030F7B521